MAGALLVLDCPFPLEEQADGLPDAEICGLLQLQRLFAVAVGGQGPEQSGRRFAGVDLRTVKSLFFLVQQFGQDVQRLHLPYVNQEGDAGDLRPVPHKHDRESQRPSPGGNADVLGAGAHDFGYILREQERLCALFDFSDSHFVSLLVSLSGRFASLE